MAGNPTGRAGRAKAIGLKSAAKTSYPFASPATTPYRRIFSHSVVREMSRCLAASAMCPPVSLRTRSIWRLSAASPTAADDRPQAISHHDADRPFLFSHQASGDPKPEPIPGGGCFVGARDDIVGHGDWQTRPVIADIDDERAALRLCP